MSEGEVLIRVENVSKKFCRSLKRSLWYGAQDVVQALMPWRQVPQSQGDEGGDGVLQPLRKDEFWAVKNVSFDVRRGECLGLIGHNGAGKSTLLKMLNSLIRPDAGRITMKGRVGALIELSAGFNPVLTGRENIYNQAALLGFSKKETDARFDAIVDFSELEGFLDTPVQNYSSGMRVRLGFAIAVQIEPDILILDEVLAVGDVAFRLKCINAMGSILRNSAVIFVSHSMPQIVRVSTSVMLMRKGQVLYCGSDLRAGIGAYLDAGGNQQEPQIFGSREVMVTSACLKFGESEAYLGEIIDVPHGSQPEFQINLSAAETVDTARLQLLIWNQEMMPVMDVVGEGLEGHLVLFDDVKDLTVRGILPPMVLNSGKYMISIHVNSDDLRSNYCRLDNAFHFQINVVSSSGAHLLGPGIWIDSAPTTRKSIPSPS